MGESDFQNLKHEQAILVDFNVFPFKIIELLELCNSNDSTIDLKRNNSICSSALDSNPSSQFIAKLDSGSGLLSVVEANRFKQLTHISLQLRPGNDSAVKLYLASRLGHALTTNSSLSDNLQQLQEQLHEQRTKVFELSEELQKYRQINY